MNEEIDQTPGRADACARTRELLAAAVGAELTGQERAAVDAHLSACATCRAVASWMGSVEQAAAHAPAPSPPAAPWLAQLRARVMDQVRAEAARSRTVGQPSAIGRVERAHRSGGLRRLWPAWPELFHSPRVLATLAVMALVGIFTYAEIRDRARLAPSEPQQVQLAEDRGARTGEPALPPSPPREAQAGNAEPPTAPSTEAPASAAGGTPSFATTKREAQAVPAERSAPTVGKAATTVREFGADEPAVTPPAAAPARSAAADGRLEQAHRQEELVAQSATPAGELLAEAAFDSLASRTAEVTASAGDTMAAAIWDPDRVRAAIALVLEAQGSSEVEAAVGELLAGVEASPSPTRAFAGRARRTPVLLRAPVAAEQATEARDQAAAPIERTDARRALAAKDQARELAPARRAPLSTAALPQTPAPLPAPRWSDVPAAASATSLTDSAAVALLLRLPQLPEGPVRDLAASWLRRHGVQ